MKRSLLVISIILSLKGVSQTSQLDSLKQALESAKHDTTRCNILSQLAEMAPDGEWQKYNEQLKNSAETNLNSIQPKHYLYSVFKKHLAVSLNNSGVMYDNQGDIHQALNYYTKSLKVHEEIGDKNGIALSLHNIGGTYSNQGNILKALEFYSKSLKIQEEIGDKYGIAISLNSIGGIYKNQDDFLKAFDNYTKCLKIREEIGDKNGIAISLNNIGYLYENQNNFTKALECYYKSLKISEDIRDKSGIARTLNNIGFVYKNQAERIISPDSTIIREQFIKKAMECYNNSLKICEEISNKKGIAVSLSNIGSIFLIQKNYIKSIDFLSRSMIISKELGYPENIGNAANKLFLLYRAKGSYKLALENYEIYTQMRDSIRNEENRKASIKSQLKYEYEKKAAADSVKVAEEKKVTAAQLKQEKTQRYALYGGLGLVGVFALFMVNRFRVTNKQKKLIETQKKTVEEQKHIVDERQKEIIDSIHYAKRIQTALLTNEKYIHRNLKSRSN